MRILSAFALALAVVVSCGTVINDPPVAEDAARPAYDRKAISVFVGVDDAGACDACAEADR